MSERLYAQLAALLERETVVLATVLDTRGAVPRHRGAQMLVGATHTESTVGGGRLEARVVVQARALLGSDRATERVDIDLTGRHGADGICGGLMQVALRRWHGAADRARAQQIAATLHDGESVLLTASDLGADHEHRVAADPRLLIFGAGHCGLALYRAALALDFDVQVYDARTEGYDRDDYARGTCLADVDALRSSLATTRRVDAVLLNRDYLADIDALRILAERPPQFIGMMGSRKRIAEVFAALPDLADFCARVHAPIGVEIGAETPDEIAISILAQLIATSRQNRD